SGPVAPHRSQGLRIPHEGLGGCSEPCCSPAPCLSCSAWALKPAFHSPSILAEAERIVSRETFVTPTGRRPRQRRSSRLPRRVGGDARPRLRSHDNRPTRCGSAGGRRTPASPRPKFCPRQ